VGDELSVSEMSPPNVTHLCACFARMRHAIRTVQEIDTKYTYNLRSMLYVLYRKLRLNTPTTCAPC
jgi:hypothetical protein